MTYTQVWDVMRSKVSDRMIQRDADYQKFKEWLAKGNKPESAAKPPENPKAR